MKLALNKKTKIGIIITLVLILAGLAIFSFFGFNKTVDYDKGYRIEITTVDITEDKMPLIKETADKYFAESGLKVFRTKTINGGETLEYIFGGKIDNFINYATEVEAKVQTALDAEVLGYNVEATANYTAAVNDNQYFNIFIALLIAVAIIFVYLIFLEKLAGSLTTLFTAIISAFLYVMLLAITRIPSQPFILVFSVVSAGLAIVISSVIVNRCNEALKLVGNEKTQNSTIAEKMTNSSLLRIAFIGGLALICGLLLIIIGNFYLKVLGMHLIVSTACATFSSITYTGLLWSLLKK